MIQDSSVSTADVSRDRHSRGRFIVGVLGVCLLLVGISLLIYFFFVRSQASLSSYVQGHGVRCTAVIQHVNNIAHWSGGRNSVKKVSYTAEVLVRLAAPVGGHAQTTSHVPRFEDGVPGQTLAVLVDPKDPGYAELPGSPRTPPSAPRMSLIGGAVSVVIGGAASALVMRSRRRSGKRRRS